MLKDNQLKGKKVILITGPTASGKSALALRLAKERDCEIISADSRQIYREIPIVTAAPTAEEQAEVVHHLVGCLPLEAYYSAASFEDDALKIIRSQFEERDTVIVCGGSMMYVDALCYGIDELPTIPDDFRENLKKETEAKGDGWIVDMLKLLDPDYYRKVDLKNIRRVFHAVEISLYAGVPYSSLLTGRKVKRDFEIEKIVIEMPRDLLFERINRRVDEMLKMGMEEEALRVYPRRHLNSLNTVGLKEMFEYFDGKLSRDEAIERVKRDTRVFAKKQITWLKRRL